MMSADIFLWWFSLCAVSVLNIAAWAFSARVLSRRQGTLTAEDYATRRLQLILCAGYVFGCAFRSAVPVYDVPRICLADSWLCSVIIGRTVATIAELCFAAQWALLVRQMGLSTGSSVAKTTAQAIVPLIAVAETCSWYSVLTTSNLGHVMEESIWGLCAVLLVVSLVTVWRRCNTALRPLLALWCAAGVAYVVFMFLVDVPMYWSRWLADEVSGRLYLGLAEGVLDVAQRWSVSHRWEDWQHEVTWMSLYFSIAVWFSIALVHVPAFWASTFTSRHKRQATAFPRIPERPAQS